MVIKGNIFIVNNNGAIASSPTNSTAGVRPVITINGQVTINGNGTINNPYTIDQE